MISAVFNIRETYDREQASDGLSRYGSYLGYNASRFRWPMDEHPSGEPMGDDDRGHFAQAAFTVATSLMSPGYVGFHPRVIGTRWLFDDKQHVAILVDLAGATPAGIRGRWPGWDVANTAGRTWWNHPESAGANRVYTTHTVLVSLITKDLPTPKYNRRDAPDTATAKSAVAVVVNRVNAVASQALESLLRERA